MKQDYIINQACMLQCLKSSSETTSSWKVGI